MTRYLKYMVMVVAVVLMAASRLAATETENYGLRILPVPKAVTIDGKTDDWDLSAGVFACGDVENQRDKYGVWIHAMWDKDNLYILARWQDLTPMNNPGSIKGDYGFNGDCLQFRVVTAPADKLADATGKLDLRNQDDLPGTRVSHITAWRDREGLDTLQIGWGHRFNEGGCDGKAKGGKQAFVLHADGRGYDQELSVPWSALSRDGWVPQAGERIVVTVEPNFLTTAGSRLTIKDIFRAGAGIDRVFTFGAVGCWGYATLESKGNLTPAPVRLADGREFKTTLANGMPVIDWTGLVKSREPDGFKAIRFSLDEDGYVSLNIFRADGTVARQLLASAFYTKGEHEVKWDGLGTMSVRIPGQPVEAGEYTWGGIWQPGISLSLRGWAGSTAATPWGNGWGADHGDPCAVAADGERVYVGWAGGEGSKPLLACSPAGDILWKQIRGGIASASVIAAADGTVYVWNEMGQYAPRSLYRVHAKDGNYSVWESTKETDLTMAQAFAGDASIPERPSGLAAGKGMVFIAGGDRVAVVDAVTGKTLRKLDIPMVSALQLGADGRLYALSAGNKVVSIDPAGGTPRDVGGATLEGKDWARALAVDAEGNCYLGITGDHHYIQVLDRNGRVVRTIGRKEGRPLVGPWQPDGLLKISALAIDSQGQLWATEDDGAPRRVSVWNPKTGAFIREFFGASTYGAMGACIDPADPYRMAGQGCEWRLDSKTGRAACLGVVTRHGMMNSRYGFGPDGREYLATSGSGGCGGSDKIRFFERLGDGKFKLRAMLTPGNADKKQPVIAWADENDDGIEQPNEVKSYDIDLGGWIQGWYMAITPDLTCYGSLYQVKVSAWTACGAPVYDFSKATLLPGPKDGRTRGGMGAQHNAGSADNRFVLWNGGYGDDHSQVECYELSTGRRVWTYPSNFTGVHGSHRACPPEVGMIRGAYDICGSVTLPKPIGNIWVIPTNKGEWHALTEEGYYLTKFWEGDVMKAEFPDKALPGADCTRCPPGAAEEAFGGSVCLDKQGGFSIQGGHSSFWNVEVHGLERAKALPGGKLSMSAGDVAQAANFRQRYLTQQEGDRSFKVAHATPTFTGDMDKDFQGKTFKAFERQEHAGVRASLAWDDQNLYAARRVADDTPWVNGADAPEFLYARGDTVDLQLGMDPQAAAKRDQAGVGDLRLSIGVFQGKTTAVIYRRTVAQGNEKHAKSFNSGVYKNYIMESVTFPDEVKVQVKVADDRRSYTVEAAIPWSVLGPRPATGTVLRGDMGATHGNKAGNDTVLRSYWANLNTGLISDEVEELMLTPAAWGELRFE